MTWQPIETAPRDGVSILVYDDMDYFVVQWDGKGWWNGLYDIEFFEPVYITDTIEPTHWQPLPPPPTD